MDLGNDELKGAVATLARDVRPPPRPQEAARRLFEVAVRSGVIDPAMRQLLPLLGNIRNATSAKAERVLGWKPRAREEAVTATAESLVRFGIVGPAAQKAG